jgi:hypothetical protein
MQILTSGCEYVDNTEIVKLPVLDHTLGRKVFEDLLRSFLALD